MARPHLKYVNVAWHPRPRRIQELEKQVKKTTKIIMGERNIAYESELRKLKLPTVVYRRIRADMIDTYTFITGKLRCSLKWYLRSNMLSAIDILKQEGIDWRLLDVSMRCHELRNFFSLMK